MRKIIFAILVSIFVLSFSVVEAKSEFYENSQNVKIEYNKYKELCNIYSENFVEFMEQDFYNRIKSFNREDFEIVEIENNIVPLSLEVTTEYKNLRFIKVGSQITLMLKWLKIPSTRSYDVIGIRTEGVRISSTPLFKLTYVLDGTRKSYTTNSSKNFSNGYGTSFKIPDGNITTLETSLSFNISESGKIYGTYQHAQRSLSLNDSKNYTLSSNGYGSVLNFDSSIRSKYDNMEGIDMII